MPKLLQINPVIRRNTSTGKIMQEIGELAMQNGWESYIAYSGGRDGVNPAACKSHIVPVGSRLSVALHGLETRLFDRHGLGSRIATRRFVSRIREIDPDIIHIHNIHGYFLNYKILFRYLAQSGKPVIWTVHDCWLYTGHCYHYASVGCVRWRTGCGNCPQKHKFPNSWVLDRSAKNYIDKSAAFNSPAPARMILVTVSEWMRREMAESFLGERPFCVIHNGIDTSTFRPCHNQNAVREKYAIKVRHVILAVSSIWLNEKGINDILQLSYLLGPDELIVMVGKMTAEQLAGFADVKNILTIPRTDNVGELVGLYSLASVLINPTWQDNYPTVNLESIACGTPVITYRTGGSVESVVEGVTGYIVEQGDVKGLLEKVREVEVKGKDTYTSACRAYAEAHFRKQDRYRDYIELYDKLVCGLK